MSTLIGSTTGPGLTWRLTVPLLVAGALAAGCGAASSSALAGGGTAATGSVAGGAPTSGAVHGSAPATPIVPTVSGGPVTPGGVACTDWPAGTGSVSLPASFVPVSVERCVNGATTIPGKGLWTTATLQRSTSDLSVLLNALREPSATRQPGTVCPALAVIPPQVVLIDAHGAKLIPRIPVSGCGLPAAQVLTALDSLRWQQVSVRLIAKISGGTSPTPASVSGTAPHSTATAGGGHVHPG